MKDVHTSKQEEGIRKDTPFNTRLSQYDFLILYGGPHNKMELFCAGLGQDTVVVTQHRVYSMIKREACWSGYELCMKRRQKWRWSCWKRLVSPSAKRFVYSPAAVCVAGHFQHNVIARKSKAHLEENYIFWVTCFNARNVCCPWAINNSLSALGAPQYICVCSCLWAYTFAWVCVSVKI